MKSSNAKQLNTNLHIQLLTVRIKYAMFVMTIMLMIAYLNDFSETERKNTYREYVYHKHAYNICKLKNELQQYKQLHITKVRTKVRTKVKVTDETVTVRTKRETTMLNETTPVWAKPVSQVQQYVNLVNLIGESQKVGRVCLPVGLVKEVMVKSGVTHWFDYGRGNDTSMTNVCFFK